MTVNIDEYYESIASFSAIGNFIVADLKNKYRKKAKIPTSLPIAK